MDTGDGRMDGTDPSANRDPDEKLWPQIGGGPLVDNNIEIGMVLLEGLSPILWPILCTRSGGAVALLSAFKMQSVLMLNPHSLLVLESIYSRYVLWES